MTDETDKALITPEIIEAVKKSVSSDPTGVQVVFDANKTLNRGNNETYKINDFLNRSTFIKTLSKTKLDHHYFVYDSLDSLMSEDRIVEKYGDLSEFSKLVDNEKIRDDLVANPDKVLAYIERHALDSFVVFHYNDLPASNTDEFKHLLKYVKDGERTFNKMTLRGKVVDDAEGLLRAIKSYPIITRYRIIGDRTIFFLGGDTDLADLASKCLTEIQGKHLIGTINKKDGEVIEITPDHLVVGDLLSRALSIQLNAYLKARRTSTPVNIRKDYKGDYIPKPPIDSIDKDLANENPNKLRTLTQTYATTAKLEQENGLFATANDPSLFDLLPPDYSEPEKFIELWNSTNFRAMVTLFRYMIKNPNPPSELDIDELASYYGAYDEQIKKQGYLPPVYRKQFFNELLLLQGSSTYFTYVDKKTYKEMIGTIRFFDFSLSTDGKTIKNLRYTEQYLLALNNKEQAMLHLVTPKSLDYLNRTHQKLAFRIIRLFVDKGHMKKTMDGKPVETPLTTLYQGILANATTKQQRAKRKAKVIEALNTIQSGGEIIKRYEITRRGNKDYVVLYPADYQRYAYKDAKLSKALEQAYRTEQKERQDALEQLIKNSKRDLRGRKDAYNNEQYVAEDLGITSDKLAKLRLKPNARKSIYPDEIDDELATKIYEQLSYYE